jgi:anti-sigma factor RsiW
MTDRTLDDRNPHDEAEELLPWYVTGRLDQADRERVEKHLTNCADCQAQLRLERRLADEYRAYSPHVEASWTSLRERIAPALTKRPSPPPANANWWRSLSRPAVATFMAAQLAVVVLAAGTVSYLNQPDAAYRALGSAPIAASANAVVIFQPQTREEQLRRLLNASGAELVGGPTDADAYVLHISPDGRSAALARLRARPEVVMAEPIDGQTP